MTQTLFQDRRSLLLLAAVVVFCLFYHTGTIPLFDEDEGAYAQVTQEMLHSGDLVTPRLGGEPFFHKPPMIYWTQAICVSLLGPRELAFRLPSVLASLAWGVLLFWFVRRHVNHRTAGLAVFILVTALQTSLITRSAIADALLNLFITLTMFAVYTYSLSPQKKYVVAAYVGMGLGFMTKGPIAVAIPVMVSLLYFLSRREMKTWCRLMFHPAGWAIFLVIALPWYLLLVRQYGWHFIREIFLVHNLGRFRSPMEGHSGSIFYYVPVILVGLLPFSTLLVRACAGIRSAFSQPLDRFLWLWFAFVFVFFSVAGTKLHHYLVYGYIPLVIFMARAADREEPRSDWLLVFPALLFLALLLLLPDLGRWWIPRVEDRFAQMVAAEALPTFGMGYHLAVALTMAGLAAVAALRRWPTPAKTLAMGGLFFLLVSGVVLPRVADILQGPVKTIALAARKQNLDVVMWRMNYPSFHVYYGRPARRGNPKPGDTVITKADKLDDVKAHSVIYQKYGIVLTRIDNL